MRISWIVFFSIGCLFSLAYLDKDIELIKVYTILTSNLISGYLGYLIKTLDD